MDDAPFVTLAAGGMQPEPSPSPVNLAYQQQRKDHVYSSATDLADRVC